MAGDAGRAHGFEVADSHPPSLARLAGGEPVGETAHRLGSYPGHSPLKFSVWSR